MFNTRSLSATCIVLFSCFTGTIVHAGEMRRSKEKPLEARIRALLSAIEFKEERREILSYGSRALPVLAKILSSTGKDKSSEMWTTRALALLKDFGGKARMLHDLVPAKLLDDSPGIRYRAVQALAAIGNREDVPALVAMLNDFDGSISIYYQSVIALGKLGDDDAALLALDIWHKRAQEHDKTHTGQWLDESMRKRLAEAKNAIRQRIKKKKAAAAKRPRPPAADKKFEARIRFLLKRATDVSNDMGVYVYQAELLAYGDKALPALAKILSAPKAGKKDDVLDTLVRARALATLGEIGSKAATLRPLLRRYLLSEKIDLRGNAVAALGAIGSSDDVPALIVMLNDPEGTTQYRRPFPIEAKTVYESYYGPEQTILYQTLAALGKLGKDANALLALRIWHKQAARAEQRRRQRWNNALDQLKKSTDAIRDRLE